MPHDDTRGRIAHYVPAQDPFYAHAQPGFPGPRMDGGGDSEGWELLCKLWRRKWMILGVCVLMTGLAGVAASTLAPRYSAEARVLVGTQQPNVTDIKAVLESISPTGDAVRTESYVVTSRTMARTVAERLSLHESPVFNPTLTQEESWTEKLGLADTFDAARAAVVGLVAAVRADATTQTVAAASAGGTGTQTGNGTSSGTSASESSGGGSGSGSGSGGGESGTVSPQVWETIEGRLLSRVRAEPLQRSHVMTITAETEDPELSARIANAFAEAYTEQTMSEKTQAAKRASDWLSQRLDTLRQKVQESERAVEEYRSKHDLFSTQSETVVGQQMASLNEKLVDTESELAEAKSRLTQAEGLVGQAAQLETVPSVLQSPQILSLRNMRSELEREAAELSSDYTDKHPKMRSINNQIEDIEGEINAEIKRIVSSLRNQVQIAQENYDRVVSRMEQVKSQMGESNSDEVKLRQLEREAQANRALYEALLKRSKETAYQADIVTPGAEVVSAAAVPGAPSFPPNKLILAIGGLVGFGLGVLLALLFEKLDQTFRTPEDVEDYVGLPSLAMLPKIKVRRNGRCDYVMRHPHSVYADGLRMLGAQLSFDERRGEIPGLTIFTSALPGEGKSHTSCSYAQMMANEGHKVVLLDLDWRQPRQHRLFGQHFRRTGVLDLLNGDTTPDEILHEDPKSGVHVLFAGKMSRMRGDTVSLDRLRALMETLSKHYDLVVVDTSPLRVTPEVMHLARIADRLVIAVKWGSTRRNAVVAEVKNLVRAGAKISGIVLTQVEPKRYKRYSYGDGDYMHQGYLAEHAS